MYITTDSGIQMLEFDQVKCSEFLQLNLASTSETWHIFSISHRFHYLYTSTL